MREKGSDRPGGGTKPFDVKRLWPIAVLIAGFGLFFALGLDDYFSFAALRQNRAWLLAQVESNAAASAIVYILVYIVVVAFSLPGGALLTILGGFLFGLVLGSAYVIVGATIGATALFLIAKTALGDPLKARLGPWMGRMEAGFRENEFSYLLFLRLIPIFPFFVVNLAPAFLGVSLRTYFLTTLVGIVPGTVVYIQVGAGLGSIFESGKDFTPSDALTPDVILALVGLSILSLLPILYKNLKRTRKT